MNEAAAADHRPSRDESVPLSWVSRTMNATPQRIYTELADGWAYVGWVVGANHIRDVDTGWPGVGTRIHHKVGVWPTVISDETESLLSEPDRRLRLRAKGWPFGEAIVEIRLEPLDVTATRVRLGEAPSAGPGRWLDNRLLRWALRRRNAETLSRLADRVEHRPTPHYEQP